MTTRRRIGIALAAMVVVSIAAGIGRAAWRRAQEPKYEGRTASEWLDELAARSPNGMTMDELAQKEGEIVFRSLGVAGQRLLVRDYLNYEWPSDFRTNLFVWGEKLPARLRPRFLWSPVPRAVVCREVLNLIRPEWEVFQPEVVEAFATGGDKGLTATMLLGSVGQGASNAVPLLISTPTNASPRFRGTALRAINSLGTNAVGAVPELIHRLDLLGSDTVLLNSISHFGPAASGALPKLEHLFGLASEGANTKNNLAVVLLCIEPNHEAAARFMANWLRIRATNSSPQLSGPGLSLLWYDIPPNTKASELAREEANVRDGWLRLAKQLLRTDELAGVGLLRAKFFNKRFNTSVDIALNLLLQHDSNDPAALNFLEDQVGKEFFPRDTNRWLLINCYRHCLPDSPGVVELLNSIQPAPDDKTLRQAIRDTLRHIELNGKLKELRERDAAAER